MRIRRCSDLISRSEALPVLFIPTTGKISIAPQDEAYQERASKRAKTEEPASGKGKVSTVNQSCHRLSVPLDSDLPMASRSSSNPTRRPL